MSETSASDGGPSVAAPDTAPTSLGGGEPSSDAGQDQPQSGSLPTPDSAASAVPYRASYVFLLVVTAVNLVADLWSKHWAKSTFEALKPGQPRKVVVIEDMMNFIYAQNFGGAWGLLQKADESVRRPFFLAVSVIAIVFIVTLYRRLQPGQFALKWGLPLVLGGALGNLVDRVRYGFVVDFIDIYIMRGSRQSHWPTFNVADISICVGVVLMAVDMFTSRPVKVTSSEATSEDSEPSAGDAGSSDAADDAAGSPASEVPAPGAEVDAL